MIRLIQELKTRLAYMLSNYGAKLPVTVKECLGVGAGESDHLIESKLIVHFLKFGPSLQQSQSLLNTVISPGSRPDMSPPVKVDRDDSSTATSSEGSFAEGTPSTRPHQMAAGPINRPRQYAIPVKSPSANDAAVSPSSQATDNERLDDCLDTPAPAPPRSSALERFVPVKDTNFNDDSTVDSWASYNYSQPSPFRPQNHQVVHKSIQKDRKEVTAANHQVKPADAAPTATDPNINTKYQENKANHPEIRRNCHPSSASKRSSPDPQDFSTPNPRWIRTLKTDSKSFTTTESSSSSRSASPSRLSRSQLTSEDLIMRYGVSCVYLLEVCRQRL